MNDGQIYEEEPPSIAMLCRRHGYETIHNQSVYCGIEEDCLYKSEERDEYGYRCMQVEKAELWRYVAKGVLSDVVVEEK